MDARTVFAWLLVTVLGVVTWLILEPFLSWLLVTGLLAVVLHPVQRRLEPRFGARPSAGVLVAVVVLLVVVGLGLGTNVALSHGIPLLESLGEAQALRRVETVLEQVLGRPVSITPVVEQGVDRATTLLGDRATSIIGRSLHVFLGFLLLTFLLYYLLTDGPEFVGWLQRVAPLDRQVSTELFAAADHLTWAVLKGHVFVAIVQGLVAGISLFVTGVPEAGTLTLAMMILAIVPIIGVAPVLGGAVVYLFLQGNLLSAAFIVLWGVTTVAITDDYLRAYLIDRESELHSATIFVGVLGGTYLLGAMGLFVGPILVGLFKTTVEVFGDHYDV
ncbi:AI-2E family transporter [Haloarculaceae archaeon H-GB1-1]|nr:AI-2E family transporter [Haloarculaceae archaeon H-GB1-1]